MIERLLRYISERQVIHERRVAGDPWPWTEDEVLQSRKFCCVIRDDDRTSQEAKTVIKGLPEDDRLGAALGFRLYNRVSTLEALASNGWRDIPATLAAQNPAINATAYKISVKGGLFNIKTIGQMVHQSWRARTSFERRSTAYRTCAAIRGANAAGAFLAYQIAQDLRWLHGPYDDEQTWCVLGLGACRGLARLQGVYQPMDWKQKQAIEEEGHYQRLLGFRPSKEDMVLHPRAQATLAELLPATGLPSMMELEHNLCEWDKYERIKSGEAPGRSWRPRGAV